jgi:hypothetical protein
MGAFRRGNTAVERRVELPTGLHLEQACVHIALAQGVSEQRECQ